MRAVCVDWCGVLGGSAAVGLGASRCCPLRTLGSYLSVYRRRLQVSYLIIRDFIVDVSFCC